MAAGVVAALAVPKDHRGRIAVDGTMRCPSRPELWGIGDCAAITSPSGEPYPTLAQHAMREARVLARNILGVVDHRPPRPFIFRTLGMMGSLGHNKGFALLIKFRVRGRLAWFVRRTYYLLQMPGWARRLRIVIDWTFALLFRPDIVKIGLDSEAVAILREESQRRKSRRSCQGNRQNQMNGTTMTPRAHFGQLPEDPEGRARPPESPHWLAREVHNCSTSPFSRDRRRRTPQSQPFHDQQRSQRRNAGILAGLALAAPTGDDRSVARYRGHDRRAHAVGIEDAFIRRQRLMRAGTSAYWCWTTRAIWK